MVSRDELYCKFGRAAEAAQLFETELGTLLLGAKALENGWHVVPDSDRAQKAFEEIDRSTLGRLLNRVQVIVELDEDIESQFASALVARNRLIHGFFLKHGFKIQSDEGRDLMIADLEVLHEELFRAWMAAQELTDLVDRRLRNEG